MISMDNIKLWVQNDPEMLERHCHEIIEFLLSHIQKQDELLKQAYGNEEYEP